MARVRVHRGGDWESRSWNAPSSRPARRSTSNGSRDHHRRSRRERCITAWLREVDARSGLRKTRTAITPRRQPRTFLHYITAQKHVTPRRNKRARRRIHQYPHHRSESSLGQHDRFRPRDHTWFLRVVARRTRDPVADHARRAANTQRTSAVDARRPRHPESKRRTDTARTAADRSTPRRGDDTQQRPELHISRDAAFISLGLACGARADTLAHLLTYEVPQAPRATPRKPSPIEGDLIQMRLPGAVSKTSREVVLPPSVTTSTESADSSILKEAADGTNWTTDATQASDPGCNRPTAKFRGIVDTDGVRRPFNTMTADDRRRLVTETANQR